MWFELVLNGIGGKTVKEAKENLSYEEAMQWQAYRNLRGSLNHSRHTNVMDAQMLLTTLKINGDKKTTFEELAPYENSDKKYRLNTHTEAQETSAEDIFKMLSGL